MISTSCDNVNVVFAKLPDYLINTDFREPTNSKLSPHAFALGQPLWNRMALEPRRSKIFDNFMTAFKKNRENWVDFFPFNEEFGEHLTEDETLIVDVAGGVGHRLRDFKIKYPKTTGKAVLQDLGYVLPTADRDPENFAGLQESGIELMEYDYSKVQPIYGQSILFLGAGNLVLRRMYFHNLYIRPTPFIDKSFLDNRSPILLLQCHLPWQVGQRMSGSSSEHNTRHEEGLFAHLDQRVCHPRQGCQPLPGIHGSVDDG